MNKIISIYFFLVFSCGIPCLANTLLLIQSHGQAHLWTRAYRQGLQAGLGDQYHLTHFNLNADKLPTRQMPAQANLAWQIIRETKPNLIFLADDAALKYLGPRLENTNMPVIYFGINDDPAHYALSQVNHITGFIERPNLSVAVRTLKKIMGAELHRVLILSDNSAHTKALVRDMNGRYKKVVDITLNLFAAKNWMQWKNKIRTAKQEGYDAILIALSGTLQTQSGDRVPNQQVIEWTAQHTNVPPFALWVNAVGRQRAIGGYVMDGFAQGKAAARLALDILNGRHKAGVSTPQKISSGKLVFSRQQLAKWKLTLPHALQQHTLFLD